MKILLFGGTGLIGKAIVDSPEFDGHQFILVSRKPDAYSGNDRIFYIPYDKSILQDMFTGEYIVINLAGAGIGDRPWSRSRKEYLLESRVSVSRIITDLVENAKEKPKVILQASAVGYYGWGGEEVITESSPNGEGFLAEITSAWEESMKTASKQNVRIVYLRTGLVLARHGGLLPRFNQFLKLFVGGYFGNGNQWMPWIHIDDEVRAIHFLMTDETCVGPYNLVAPKPERMKYFLKKLGKMLNRPSWLHVPAFVVRLLPGGFGTELLLVSQNVKPEKLLEAGFKFRFKDLKFALNNLYNNE